MAIIKAVQFSSFGEPEEVLSVVSYDLPEPDEETVQIRVLLSNMNYSDLVLIRGRYGFMPELPALAGAEGVGIIEKKGANVVDFSVGERVCFYSLYGAWATRVNVRQNHIVKVPEGLPDEVAAQFFTNPIAAEAMIQDTGLQKGDSILLTAAASSVGRLMIQFASRRGVDVIAVVRNTGLDEVLLSLGAKAVINSSAENVSNRVKEITQNRGVKYVFDAVAGKLASQLMYCLEEGGTLVIYGALSTERVPLSPDLLIAKGVHVTSFWTHRWVNSRYKGIPEQYMLFKKKLIQNMLDWNISLPAEKIYPLEEVKEAIRHFQQGGRKSKLLISPGMVSQEAKRMESATETR